MSRDCCVALPHDVKEFFSSVCECIFFPDHTNLLFLQEPIFMFVCFVLLLYVPSQQLWSLRDGQLT